MSDRKRTASKVENLAILFTLIGVGCLIATMMMSMPWTIVEVSETRWKYDVTIGLSAVCVTKTHTFETDCNFTECYGIGSSIFSPKWLILFHNVRICSYIMEVLSANQDFRLCNKNLLQVKWSSHDVCF